MMKYFIPGQQLDLQKVANDIAASYSGFHPVNLVGKKIIVKINEVSLIQVTAKPKENGTFVTIGWTFTGAGWIFFLVACFSALLPALILCIAVNVHCEPKEKDIHKIITTGRPLAQTAPLPYSNS